MLISLNIALANFPPLLALPARPTRSRFPKSRWLQKKHPRGAPLITAHPNLLVSSHPTQASCNRQHLFPALHCILYPSTHLPCNTCSIQYLSKSSCGHVDHCQFFRLPPLFPSTTTMVHSGLQRFQRLSVG